MVFADHSRRVIMKSTSQHRHCHLRLRRSTPFSVLFLSLARPVHRQPRRQLPTNSITFPEPQWGSCLQHSSPTSDARAGSSAAPFSSHCSLDNYGLFIPCIDPVATFHSPTIITLEVFSYLLHRSPVTRVRSRPFHSQGTSSTTKQPTSTMTSVASIKQNCRKVVCIGRNYAYASPTPPKRH